MPKRFSFVIRGNSCKTSTPHAHCHHVHICSAKSRLIHLYLLKFDNKLLWTTWHAQLKWMVHPRNSTKKKFHSNFPLLHFFPIFLFQQYKVTLLVGVSKLKYNSIYKMPLKRQWIATLLLFSTVAPSLLSFRHWFVNVNQRYSLFPLFISSFLPLARLK